MNRLSNEKSPYLLQHAENPVHWYPWGDEAFQKAASEDKPVFLSVGYATCHWCHVMAHESFEDEKVARLMNDAFINIKVDREERPDIDNTYMTVCQMLTGRGGWPLTIIMTPGKEPFFAATYLPKHSRGQHPGMIELVPQIQKLWQNDRKRIEQSVNQIREGFATSLSIGRSGTALADASLTRAVQTLKQRFDKNDGGFGREPKFPSPHILLYLLRYGTLKEDNTAVQMAETTLQKMRLGGLWDHIGGGFHRYSTDSRWLLPHFEKMLYDQAMMMLTYAEAWRITRKPLYKETCYQLFEYLNKKMRSDSGGFYSAEDADSEGEEGKFYVWNRDEIFDYLPEHDARFFCDVFNVEKSGNYRDESTGTFTGMNIPHLHHSYKHLADERGISIQSFRNQISPILEKLYNEREKRAHPLLDDKILTDWNGLMIAALATAGAIFDEPRFTEAAEKSFQFISSRLLQNDGTLLHRFRDQEAAIEGMADDYTMVIWGLIELHQTTQNISYLKKALDLQRTFDRYFTDDQHGGYFFTAIQAEQLLGRQKEIYDGALPSSNSVAALNAFRLSRLTGDTRFEEHAEKVLTCFSDSIDESPSGYTFALLSKLMMSGQPAEIAVVANNRTQEVQKTLKLLSTRDRFLNSTLLKTPESASETESIAPFTVSFPVEESLSIYVCREFSCQAPVHSAQEMLDLIDA